MSSSKNSLPQKESALFKRLLSTYEQKQYKNCMKISKQILSNPKCAENGETLALKGLTLNALGRKKEGYECVRKGLKNDLRSHLSWHVYGLLQKSDQKYDEAIKCYRNALKWDKDNVRILRDLSLLQIQIRDLEGYRDTTYQLFLSTSNQRVSWISYAVSLQLLGEHQSALKILYKLLSQHQSRNTYYDYEYSEMLLYQNFVIRESGDFKQALIHLEQNENQIVDKVTVKEALGDLNLELKQFKEAARYFEDLIRRNTENTTYYNKLIKAKQLTNHEDILKFYYTQSEEYPKSNPPKRLALNYAVEETFETLIDNYLRRGFRKGVPALFVELKSLYADKRKVEIIEKLLLQYVDALKANSEFNHNDIDEGFEESVSCLLWVYYFLAQHYDYLQQIEKALNYINTAIEYTPTLVELYITKGRIYKHAGDPYEACKWLDEAQSLDTADRCINAKCTKYMLRANRIEEAEKISTMFSRQGISVMESFNEKQCMWFLTECALAYQRLGKYGEALKKCHEVDKHFSEIIDDQYDFHTYCTRKLTLRSYLTFLRVEDNLRSNPFYFKASQCAIEVYLHLFDTPQEDSIEINMKKLSLSEQKKLLNKKRKARRKAEQENNVQAQTKKEHQGKKAGEETDTPKSEELLPEKLEKVNDPLEEAIKFLRQLQNFAHNKIETHLMAFEIYFRKQKLLLMLQSLKRAHDLNPSNPKLHSCMVRFWRLVKDASHPITKEVIESETRRLFDNNEDAMQLNKNYLERNGDNLKAVLEGAKMLYYLNPNFQNEAIELVTKLDKYQNVDFKTCSEVLKSLKGGEFGLCDSQIETFMAECRSRFLYAVDFRKIETNICKIQNNVDYKD